MRQAEEYVVDSIREEGDIMNHYVETYDEEGPVKFKEIGTATNDDSDLWQVVSMISSG